VVTHLCVSVCACVCVYDLLKGKEAGHVVAHRLSVCMCVCVFGLLK
jgi:hypothetical protein